MEKKATRLHFTEDELANEAVRKAADRADQAAGKAEEAVKKASSRPKKKLRTETDASAARKGKLRFEKAEHEPVLDTPSRGKHMITRASYTATSARAHQAVSEHEDDNVGVEAVHRSEEAAEATAHTINHAMYSRKMSAYNKAEKLIQKSDCSAGCIPRSCSGRPSKRNMRLQRQETRLPAPLLRPGNPEQRQRNRKRLRSGYQNL